MLSEVPILSEIGRRQHAGRVDESHRSFSRVAQAYDPDPTGTVLKGADCCFRQGLRGVVGAVDVAGFASSKMEKITRSQTGAAGQSVKSDSRPLAMISRK